MKISIITATFNSESTIKSALDSVAKQDYFDLEHLIIDGASTDNTLSIIRAHSNKNIRIISEPDDGIYSALNKGINESTGEIVGFLHADDFLQNNNVLNKIAAEFKSEQVDAIYGDLVYVQKNNVDQIIRYWRAGPYKATSFARGWMPPHPTFYVRRRIYEKYGIFNDEYKISSDYDLMLRFLAVFQVDATYIPEVLVRMRVGGVSNRSFSNILRKSLEDLMIVRSNSVGGVGTVLLKNLSKIRQFLLR